jgi:hypothetical protein
VDEVLGGGALAQRAEPVTAVAAHALDATADRVTRGSHRVATVFTSEARC